VFLKPKKLCRGRETRAANSFYSDTTATIRTHPGNSVFLKPEKLCRGRESRAALSFYIDPTVTIRTHPGSSFFKDEKTLLGEGKPHRSFLLQ
jgi:hypothetical protein